MKKRDARLYLLVCLAVPALVLSSPAAAQDDPPDYLARLVTLRTEYAAAVDEAEEAEELNALALVACGRTWATAARSLADRYHHEELARKLAAAREEWAAADKKLRAPQDRQVAGLKLFYTSMQSVAAIMALTRRDKVTFEEITTIEEHIDRAYDAEKGPTHRMAALSNGALSMMALTIRSTPRRETLTPEVDGVFEKTLQRNARVGRRDDVHYRGRLFLMVLNNFKACFRMMCLLNEAVDDRLAEEVAPIYESWEEIVENDQTPGRVLTVTLTALCEAGFPAAMTLVGR